MSEDPCCGPCNGRARRLWEAYDKAEAAWKTADTAWRAAVTGGEEAGERPEHPAEPDIKVWYGEPVFCRRCGSQVRSALAGLDHLAGLLAAQIDGMRGAASAEQEKTGKRGKASSAPSVDSRVEELDDLYRFLAGMEDWWRAINPEYGPRPYVGAMGEQPVHAGSHPRSRTLGWLGEHFTDILNHPDCGTYGLRILVWERELQRQTKSQPEPKQRAAHCPRCQRRTLWGRDDGNVECRNPDCRRVLSGVEYEEIRDADLRRGGKPAEPGEVKEAS